jgi:hypothetical protein
VGDRIAYLSPFYPSSPGSPSSYRSWVSPLHKRTEFDSTSVPPTLIKQSAFPGKIQRRPIHPLLRQNTCGSATLHVRFRIQLFLQGVFFFPPGISQLEPSLSNIILPIGENQIRGDPKLWELVKTHVARYHLFQEVYSNCAFLSTSLSLDRTFHTGVCGQSKYQASVQMTVLPPASACIRSLVCFSSNPDMPQARHGARAHVTSFVYV